MKIDLSKLEGYTEEMSAEDKLNLILGTEFTEPNKIDKATFDKTASELAKYKKQAQASMSEAEKAKAETEELIQNLRAENEGLKRNTRLSETKAKYIALGYDEDIATKSANALLDGDNDTLFEIQKEFVNRARETAIAEKVKSMGIPSGGQPQTKSFTREQIEKMSPSEINANWDVIQATLKNNN